MGQRFSGPQGEQGVIGLQGVRGPIGPDGAPGPIGPTGEVSKEFMKSNTLWCTDGEICTFPPGKNGIMWGAVGGGGAKITSNSEGDVLFNTGTTKINKAGELVAQKVRIGQWVLEQHPNGHLHVHRGDINAWSLAVTPHLGGTIHAAGNFKSETLNKWL